MRPLTVKDERSGLRMPSVWGVMSVLEGGKDFLPCRKGTPGPGERDDEFKRGVIRAVTMFAPKGFGAVADGVFIDGHGAVNVVMNTDALRDGRLWRIGLAGIYAVADEHFRPRRGLKLEVVAADGGRGEYGYSVLDEKYFHQALSLFLAMSPEDARMSLCPHIGEERAHG